MKPGSGKYRDLRIAISINKKRKKKDHTKKTDE